MFLTVTAPFESFSILSLVSSLGSTQPRRQCLTALSLTLSARATVCVPSDSIHSANDIDFLTATLPPDSVFVHIAAR